MTRFSLSAAQRADGPDDPQGRASWYTPGLSDGLGDRLLMFDNSTTGSLELLRFRPEFGKAPGFEDALRRRVDELAHFTHPSVAKVRAVESLGEDEGLALISNHIVGRRLVEIQQDARGPQFATELITQLVPVLAALQEQGGGMAHGLLTPERVIVTPEGRLILSEHVLGSAIDALQLPSARLRNDLGVIMPQGMSSVDDPRADILQLGYLALSLLVGRPVRSLDAAREIAGLNRLQPRSAGRETPVYLQRWLVRALHVDGQPFESANDAEGELADWPERELPTDDPLPREVPSPRDVAPPPARPAPILVGRLLGLSSPPAPPVPSAPPVPPPPAPSRAPAAPAAAAPPVAQPLQPAREVAPAPPRQAPPAPQEGPASHASPVAKVQAPPAPASPPPPAVRPIGAGPAPRASEPLRREVTEPTRTLIEPAGIVAEAARPVPTWPQPKERPEPKPLQSRHEVASESESAFEAKGAPTPHVLARRQVPVSRWLVASLSFICLVESLIIAGLLASRQIAPSAEAASATVQPTAPAAPAPTPATAAPRAVTSPPAVTPRTTTAPTQGRIEITSEPSGARVSIDGKPAGTTPFFASVAPGEHAVVITSGSNTTRRTVNVKAGSTATLMASLAPAGTTGGWLTVESPLELQVFEGPTLIGTTRAARLMLPSGRHQLRLANASAGFETSITVEIQAGRTVTTRVPAPNGSLSLNALPWANVSLDGQSLGTTPVANLSVTVGTHEVIWRHPQLGERRQAVVVTAKEPVRLVMDLRR